MDLKQPEIKLSAKSRIRMHGQSFIVLREAADARYLCLDEASERELFISVDEIEKAYADRAFEYEDPDRATQRRQDSPVADNDPRMKVARTIMFYLRVFDEAPCALSDRALTALIDEARPDALAEGFDWVPSPGAFRRHLKRDPGRRSASNHIAQRGRKRDAVVDETYNGRLKQHVLAFYFVGRRDLPDTVGRIAKLVRRLNRLRRRLHGDVEPMDTPNKSTIWRWIQHGTTRELYALKHGEKAAHAKFDGKGEGIKARRPLDVALMDSTPVDAWVLINTPLGPMPARPIVTYVLDLFSGAFLGLSIGVGGETIAQVCEAFISANLPKEPLRERYSMIRKVSRAWGRPAELIVDNAWAQVGTSFEAGCSSAGVRLAIAKTADPTAKAQVERFNAKLNQKLFHKLPSGIPYKPHIMRELGLEPKIMPMATLDQLYELIWVAAFDGCNSQTSDTLKGASPERVFQRGIEENGRPVIADFRRLEIEFSQLEYGRLNTSGVRLRNNRFMNKAAIDTMLAALSGREKKSTQARGRMSSASAMVKIKYREGDASQIFVWNDMSKEYIVFKNADESVTPGMSFKLERMVREFTKLMQSSLDENDCPPDRADYIRRQIEKGAREVIRVDEAKARQFVRAMVAPRAQPRFVVQETGTASDDGLADSDMKVAFHSDANGDSPLPQKRGRRGGKAATRKAMKTRQSQPSPEAVAAHAMLETPSKIERAARASQAKLDLRPPAPQIQRTEAAVDVDDLLARLNWSAS
jgi:putative transposase